MSCCSRVTRSALSSERKRYSVCEPERRFRSFVCTMPRQLPGVTCTTFITRQRSFWCWTIMPTRSCVAGINIGRDLPSRPHRRHRSRRLRRHHDEEDEPLRPRIPDSMIVARGRAHEVAGPDVALVVADTDPSRPRDDEVELVADGVAMSGLLLPG